MVLALSQARIAAQKDISADVLILGAGRAGVALLEVMRQHKDWIHINAVVDPDPEAPAIKLARQNHITVKSDTIEAIRSFSGNIIIDVTGKASVSEDIRKNKSSDQIEDISGSSAKLLFDLVYRQFLDKDTIQIQDLRLNLLNSMLDISLNLERHRNASELLQEALKSIHSSLLARKSIAVIPTEMGCEAFGILDVEIPTQLPESFAIELQERFFNFDQRDVDNDQFERLDPPIETPGIPGHFDLAIPLIRDDILIAVLLIDSEGSMDRATSALLKIAASHLRLAVKALHSHLMLEAQAIRDALTGVYNRHYFQEHLNQEVAHYKRLPEQWLSCIFFDLDYFKQINDTFGHHAGDLVLQSVAKKIHNLLREYDVFARYGGDEFIALLPFDETEGVSPRNIAERILEEVKLLRIDEFPEIRPSLSIGVATMSGKLLTDGSGLLALADKALYKAKEDGRSCVRCIENL